MSADFLQVMESLSTRLGLEYNPVLARSAIVQAESTWPGEWPQTWKQRLVSSLRRVGMRGTEVRCSTRDAASSASFESPVVAYCQPNGEWLVLVGRDGKDAVLTAYGTDARRRVPLKELARLRGLRDEKEPADWALIRSTAPAAGLRDPAIGGHGHGHESTQSPFRRLLGLLRPEAPDLWAVLLYTIGVGLLSLATPLAVEALVTTVALNLVVQQLVVLTAILFVCLALAASLRAVQTYVVEILQRRVFVRVSADLAHRLPLTKVEAFDHEYGPEIVNRFFDVLTVQKVGSLLLLDGLTLVLQALIGLVVLAFYHPFLLAFDGVVLAAMTFAIFQLGRNAVRTSIDESRAKYSVVGSLEDLVHWPLTYKQGNGPEFAFDRVDFRNRQYLKARSAHFRIVFRQIIFALGVQVVSTTALLGLGGWLVIEGQLTLGQLVAAELIVVTVAGSFAKLGKHLEGWYDLMSAMEKLGVLADLPLETLAGEPVPPVHGPAAIRFIGASYHYNDHGHSEVIHGFDLEVAAGEKIAITGPGGCGKSTLIDLAVGLRRPTSGRVELDGLDLRDLGFDSLRSVAAIAKGPSVVEGSILDNVRMGRSSLSLAVIVAALRDSAVLTELSELSDGLHTEICAGGGPTTPSQARRLSIARAIAGRPRLLVIDESLDGLDIMARRSIVEMLTSPSAPWTLLIATNEPDVIAACDRSIDLGSKPAHHPATEKRSPPFGAQRQEVH